MCVCECCDVKRKKRKTPDHSRSYYRKWFLEALGHKGLNNLLAAYEDKTAEAITTFAYSAGPGNEPLVFEGRVQVRMLGPNLGRHKSCWSMKLTCAGQDCTSERSAEFRYVREVWVIAYIADACQAGIPSSSIRERRTRKWIR